MHPENTQIGKYKIVGQVGEGAMGVVYRALDPVLNRTVAIKVMSDAIARDDDLRGRFLREAQAAGSLQHPNVITIYDCGEVDGHLYIAMEFVEGEDLEEVLRKKVALSIVDKIDIIVDVLGGLAYAHKRGIVHRDIKPANIRIDEEGRARIMDFGIAHLSSSNMTRTGVMVGTPAYMAPEQIVGGAITPATDLFSVGAVLYELLTGVRPFHADTLQSVMYKIVSQAPADLPKDLADLPPAANAIVHRALAKDTADRYSSALEMANALTELRAGLGRAAIASKSISLRSVIDTALADERAAKKKSEGRRGALIGGTIAAAAAALIAVAVFWGKSKSPTAPAPATAVASTAAAPSEANPPTASAAVVAPPTSVPVPTAAAAAATKSSAPPTQAGKSETKTGRAARSSADGPKDAPKDAPTGAPKTVDATPQELALFRSLRATALDNRRRAGDAGASADQLATGDNQVKAADASAQAGKFSDAADHLTQATGSWNGAERDARQAAAAMAASAAARPRVISAESKPASSPVPPAPAVPIIAPPAAPPAAQAAPTANAPAEIKSALAAYARAIESRDVAEVRRAYPDITPAQASGFDQFFGSVRTLRANLSASQLDVSGATAEAKVVGEYDYVTSAGQNERQPLSFQATFRKGANGWKLISVH